MQKPNKLTLAAIAVALTVQTQAAIQVWDLGAQPFITPQYQNMLSEAEINSWYTAAPGSTGITTSSITANDSCNFVFNGGGKTNHRLRTTNNNLTRYDGKSKTDANGNTYTGYIYSNSGSNPSVYVEQNYQVNDKIEFFVGSNGGAETYELAAPSGKKTQAIFSGAAGIEKLTFYISETGAHKLYGTDEKLVIARIMRTPAEYATLSGTVSAPSSIPSNYRLCFTNVQNGSQRATAPTAGSYSIDSLAMGYDYTVSLIDANGFIVSSTSPVHISATTQIYNATILAIDQKTATGHITGLSNTALAKLSFKFHVPDGQIFQPEMNINVSDSTYTLILENGIRYGIEALGVDDYQLGIDSISLTANTNMDLSFTAKPLYTITIAPTVATLADLAAATFTFTNLDAEEYVYTFTGPAGIALRNGTYSVKVSNTGIYTQLLTSNLKVADVATTKVIDFTASVSEWVFSDADFTTGGYSNASATYLYKTLEFTGAKSHNNTYLYASNGGSIKVPVQGNCLITVNACYEYHLTIGTDTLGDSTTGSTSQIDALTYTYSGSAGTVKINTFGTCYINSISVSPIVARKDTISVGLSKDYATINEALAAIRKMSRPNSERVIVLIAPGNYEEMLKVDMPNVSFVNAAPAPNITLANAGVDIDADAVRITSYYGEGYNYYSMGSNYMWDARTQAVNKENGYTKTVNPGGGSTLWNSTVFVSAKGFEAYNIIFENSFNQYISAKEANDVSEVKNAGLPIRPTTAGSTEVQARPFRERASALGFSKTADKAFLSNCRIIGRQDAIYGDNGVRVAAYKGVFMGACDYIFGGMNLTCYKTELALNTTDVSEDVAYITAAKQNAGERGYLFYQCHITSVQPLTETATTHTSKPGYFGRPWDANGETVFFQTTIDSTLCPGYSGSLIVPAGWNSGLVSTGSVRSVEYGTVEACNADNSNNRISWASVLAAPTLADGTAISCFNFTKGSDDWDPFKDLIDTGLRDNNSDSRAQVFAANGEIYFSNIANQANVQIYSLDGRLARQLTISNGSHTAMANGLWIVRLTDDNGTKAVKVLVK